MTYTKKMIVSWEEMTDLSAQLAAALAPRRAEFKTIIAVTRGGLVPAAIIARRLDIRHIDTLCISSYDGTVQGGLQVIKSVPGDGAGCLVIDDLVDKGTTAQAIRQMLPKAVIAVLYAKPSGKPFTDVFMQEVPQETWIEFPWE